MARLEVGITALRSAAAYRRVAYRGVASPRGCLWVCLLAILVVNLLQSPLSQTFDTKLDLLVDPGTFLRQSLTVWSPSVGMGEIQNQAYGYLLPIGPVFWFGHAIGLPAWLVERLWSAGLSAFAFDGTRRLARAWGGLGPYGALLAGAAFLVAPRFLTTVGTLTGEILPTALLPWAVLPLVLARRQKLDLLPAIGLSATAILFMGGVNAVETAATFPFPAVVLLGGVLAGELPRRALGLWTAAVAAACLWWVGPLLILGRFSPPFLDYIESAANTTSGVGWTNAVRGTDHWLALVSLGRHHWWQAGFELATRPGLVVVTLLVASAGLAGLARRDLPDRASLLVPLGLGLSCLVAAHGTVSGGLFGPQLRDLLDGGLAPLRNIHKVDPLVRLPLALGFAYFCRDLHRQRLPVALREFVGRVRLPRIPVAGLAVLALVAAAQPALAGRLRFDPGWRQLPTSWTTAGKYIDRLPAGSRVLVAPGSGAGLQVWGYTVDEPLQTLTTTPWVVRGQAPLTPGGTTRYLDAIESIVSAGRPSAVLAPLLLRAGITDVLIRSDLDPTTTDAPDPSLVRAAISGSPGFTRLRSFGVPNRATQPLELWKVPGLSTADPRASLAPAADLAVVDGGPEDVAPLLQSGLIHDGQPTALAGDAPGQPVTVMTDGRQRRERQFGRVHDSLSAAMTAEDRYRVARSKHDFESSAGTSARTVAWSPGLSTLTATSSAGFADVLGPVQPEHGPAAALDGLTSTDWRSAPFSAPNGQSIAMTFAALTVVRQVAVTVARLPNRPVIATLQLRTDVGTYVASVDPTTGIATFALPGRRITSLSVTAVGVDDAQAGDREIGISEISMPGVDTTRYLIAPGAASAATDLLFSAAAPTRACVTGAGCDLTRMRTAEEAAGIFRVYSSTGSGRWRVSTKVVAVPSTQTVSLLDPPANQLRIAASSVYGNDPNHAAVFGFDGDPHTRWLTAPGDVAPSLTLTWSTARTFSEIEVARDPNRSAVGGQRTVDRVTVETDGHRRGVRLEPGRVTRFSALRGTSVTIRFTSADAGTGPIDIPEISIPGLDDLAFSPNPKTRTGEPCGFGPEIVLDGQTRHTRVSGTIGDVLAARPMSAIVCGNDELTIPRGEHRLRIRSTARFQPVTAELVATAVSHVAQAGSARSLHITRWSATQRRVEVGAGSASILSVKENENPGWAATLNHTALTRVTIDGWQQGWRVPPGPGGEVILRYTPATPFGLSLFIGAVVAVVLVGLTVFAVVPNRGSRHPTRRRREVRVPKATRLGSPALAWEAVFAITIVGGVGVLIGALVVVIPGLRGLVWRRGIVFACAGVAAGLTIHGSGRSTLADLVMAGAVGVVLSPARSS
jgi:arabinofuranan 3-O-arabinosyltransferase